MSTTTRWRKLSNASTSTAFLAKAVLVKLRRTKPRPKDDASRLDDVSWDDPELKQFCKEHPKLSSRLHVPSKVLDDLIPSPAINSLAFERPTVQQPKPTPVVCEAINQLQAATTIPFPSQPELIAEEEVTLSGEHWENTEDAQDKRRLEKVYEGSSPELSEKELAIAEVEDAEFGMELTAPTGTLPSVSSGAASYETAPTVVASSEGEHVEPEEHSTPELSPAEAIAQPEDVQQVSNPSLAETGDSAPSGDAASERSLSDIIPSSPIDEKPVDTRTTDTASLPDKEEDDGASTDSTVSELGREDPAPAIDEPRDIVPSLFSADDAPEVERLSPIREEMDESSPRISLQSQADKSKDSTSTEATSPMSDVQDKDEVVVTQAAPEEKELPPLPPSPPPSPLPERRVELWEHRAPILSQPAVQPSSDLPKGADKKNRILKKCRSFVSTSANVFKRPKTVKKTPSAPQMATYRDSAPPRTSDSGFVTTASCAFAPVYFIF